MVCHLNFGFRMFDFGFVLNTEVGMPIEEV